jgi:hypothetical protein
MHVFLTVIFYSTCVFKNSRNACIYFRLRKLEKKFLLLHLLSCRHFTVLLLSPFEMIKYLIPHHHGTTTVLVRPCYFL